MKPMLDPKPDLKGATPEKLARSVVKELAARCCTIPVGSRTDPSPV